MSFLYCGKCYFKRWKRYVQEDTEDPGKWTTNCSSLRPGDIVEFNRGLFSHFAIYCGNNHIIHVSNDQLEANNSMVLSYALSIASLASELKSSFKIIEKNIDKASFGFKFRRNN